MGHCVGLDGTGLARVGRAATGRHLPPQHRVPGRVAESPLRGCRTRAGCNSRSICAGLIARSFSLTAPGSGAPRRS
jgi:hypothetical protein